MKTYNPPELLSPVGTMDSIYSAVNNGCNAVYLGGKNFNARKYATNFSDEELINIIDFCHLRNVKVLITINILYKNSEINDLLKFVAKMYSAGADAFIIQDLGVFNILRKNFPKIRLHASTQMTAHNIHSVNFLYELGFSRIVLSRELSLDEIEDINKNTLSETEVFIHGALCVSYSGRCLMSSMIGERSGNRGRCAQPCRMIYSLYKNNKKIYENYLLSPKDIMTLNSLENLIKAGVKSFKIEGRMKSPEYVAQVTKTYRKYIDLILNNNSTKPEINDIENLMQIFNRGGEFSSGYLYDWGGTKMISPSPKSSGIKIGIVESYNPKTQKVIISLSKPVTAGDGIEIWTDKEPHVGGGISKQAQKGEKISLKIKGNIKKGNYVYKSFDKLLNDELKKLYTKDTRKREIKASVIAKLNNPIKLKLVSENPDLVLELTGSIVQKAEKSPLLEEDLIKRLSKTGNTPFELTFEKIICDDNIYISLSELNNFRREALELLNKKIIEYYKKDTIKVKYIPEKNKFSEEKFITVHLCTEEQFYCALKFNIKRIYFEFNEQLIKNYKTYIEAAHKNNIEFFICFPRIFRKPFFNKFSELYNLFEKSDANGYLLRNFQKLNTSKTVVADYTFNIFNSASAEFINTIFDEYTISPELTLSEIKEVCTENSEIFVYGKIVLMTTHQCPVGLYDAKKKSGQFCSLKNNTDNYYIKDRLGIDFTVQRDCNTCTATILNSVPMCVLNKFKDIKKVPAKYFRITLTDESSKLSEEILYGHTQLLSNETPDNRTQNIISKIKENGFTGGHIFKGVL